MHVNLGPHPLGWGAVLDVCCLALMSQCFKCCDSSFNVFCVRMGHISKTWFLGCLPFEYLRLVMVCHCTKFSSSSYNGWSMEIAGIKFFLGTGNPPTWGRVCLTPRNLPLGLTCYHTPNMNLPRKFHPICPQHFELSCTQTNERTNKQNDRIILLLCRYKYIRLVMVKANQ